MADKRKVINVDDFYKANSKLGSLRQATTNALYGINHTKVKSTIPSNRENVGYVFFTRPQLNLSTDNIRNIRQFYSMLTTTDTSTARFVRNTLDPRLALGLYDTPKTDDDGVVVSATAGYNEVLDCPLVDKFQAFIPILTNSIVSLSGWPDIVLPTFTSEIGLRKEQYSQADGIVDIYESYDLDVTFRNQVNDPIIQLFQTWLRYSSSVFEGTLMPYMDFIRENEIDYMTRIYRVVLDKNLRRVNKIFANGVGFPITVPSGQFADFSDNNDYNQQVKEFTVRFRSLGAQFNDDILIREFNNVVGVFNPDMANIETITEDHLRTSSMTGSKLNITLEDKLLDLNVRKIPEHLLAVLNHRAYPRINTVTYEMEWYTDKELVDAYMDDESVVIAPTATELNDADTTTPTP